MGDFSCMPAKHGSSGRENRHPSAAISSPPDGLIYLLIGKIFGCSSRARSLLYCSFVWEVFELLWRKKSIQKVCVGIKKVYFCDRKSAHLYFCRHPAGSEQPL